MTEVTDQHLRDQRGRPAVLKMQLSRIRAQEPCALVFVLEGVDDLKIYDVWLRRVAPQVIWQPLMAQGKRRSLEFREMLKRDTTGLRLCTYFIVDHDYDGHEDADGTQDVFVLPNHSVENLLTDVGVLESLLTGEFRLIGEPNVKARILDAYRNVRSEFTAAIQPACERLAATKRASVGNVTIVENVLQFFDIGLESVRVKDPQGLMNLISTEQELWPEDLTRASEFFVGRERHYWMRGKYMLAFFKDWAQLLMTDRRSERPHLFPERASTARFSGEWCEPAALSARSQTPLGLDAFVMACVSHCSEHCQI